MVRCQTCGFLTLRQPHTGLLLEADDSFRNEGHRYGPLQPCNGGPLCFVMAHDLYAETLADRDTPELQRTLAVISRDRECSRHCGWTQGFSPKEHRMMIHDDELRRMQAEAKRADKEWQERQKESDRAWQQQQKWNDRAWNIGFGAAAFLVGYAFNEFVKPPSATPATAPSADVAPAKQSTRPVNPVTRPPERE